MSKVNKTAGINSLADNGLIETKRVDDLMLIALKEFSKVSSDYEGLVKSLRADMEVKDREIKTEIKELRDEIKVVLDYIGFVRRENGETAERADIGGESHIKSKYERKTALEPSHRVERTSTSIRYIYK